LDCVLLCFWTVSCCVSCQCRDSKLTTLRMPCRVWAAKLPIGKSDSEKALRDELFRQFDPNGNGYLSLAEVDRGVQDILELNVTASLSLHLVVWFWG
jgi:hypothetical protein